MLEGITKNEYVYAIIILVCSVILSRVIDYILKNYLKKITSKTKTDVDDKIVDAITKDIYLFIITTGVYIALKTLSIINGYLDIINKIFFIFVVAIVSIIITKILGMLISKWLSVQKKFEKTPRLITKLVNVIIYLIAILMILGHFNIEITPLIATLGIGGLAIGLALQNTLSNLFAGIHIISDKPINVGDFIEINEGTISGYVEDIGWRSTKIRTLPNTRIIIPNSKLAESVITNNSLPEKEMSIVIQCGVAYGSDLEKVEKVTIDVAKKIQKTVLGAVKTFEPFIRYHTFGDSNINFSIILRVEKFVDKYIVTHEFIKALKARYDKEKIEISWPVRKIYMEK